MLPAAMGHTTSTCRIIWVHCFSSRSLAPPYALLCPAYPPLCWLTDQNWGLGAETAPLPGIGTM
ncbi:MAG: hypothetical protein AB4042_07525 [Leptolyngbyaceae cyanobacterium]